jgi:hypothetical protein
LRQREYIYACLFGVTFFETRNLPISIKINGNTSSYREFTGSICLFGVINVDTNFDKQDGLI